MADVGAKPVTRREAVALSELRASPRALGLLLAGRLSKGDALAVARVAGIMAAKRTHEIVPLCHPVGLDCAEVSFRVGRGRIAIRAAARCDAKTGVEMEALTAASVAALCLYDMLKPVEQGMTIGPTYLGRKTGGRSGTYLRRGAAGLIDESRWG